MSAVSSALSYCSIIPTDGLCTLFILPAVIFSFIEEDSAAIHSHFDLEEKRREDRREDEDG